MTEHNDEVLRVAAIAAVLAMVNSQGEDPSLAGKSKEALGHKTRGELTWAGQVC